MERDIRFSTAKIRQIEVRELLTKADSMVKENGGSCFNGEMCQEAEAAIQKVSGSSCVQAGVGPNAGLNTHGEKLQISLYSWKGKGDTKIKLEKLISQRDTGTST